MKELFESHLHTEISLNISKPTHIDPVTLVAVHDSYFTVKGDQDGGP